MPTQVQFRRGTTAQNAGFTGANGEISIDTSKKTAIVHDGSTPGGFPLAPNTAFDVANAAFNSANNVAPQVAPAFNTANAAFDKANNALANTSNVVFAGDLRVTGNVFVGTSTVTITNNSITASSITATNLVVNGSSVPSGAVSNLAFDTANAAFDKANAANVLAYDTGIGANAYATAVGTAGNAYAVTVGTSGNNYANATFVKLTAGSQTITGDFSITGNLFIGGNTTAVSANNLIVNDPLIYLANNNLSDTLDIGFVGSYYNVSSAHVHTGLYRDHSSKQYYLFQGFDGNPEVGNEITPYSNNMVNATLVADFVTSNLNLGGANAIVWIGAAFDKANSANVLAYNTGIGANDYSVVVGTSGNNYTNTSTTAANNYAGVMANSVNAYTTATYATITTVETNATSANNWANTKIAAVTSNGAGRLWANTVVDAGIETVYVDLATSGVTAQAYTGGVSAITVDAYGRVTSVTGSAGYITSGGASVGDQTTSASTFYPIFSTTTSGTLSVANVSTTKLTFVPSTGTLSSTILNSTSDINKKENIEPIVDAVESINSINGYTFNWKDNGNESIGVIAQEVEKVLPCLVDESGDGKSVNYNGLVAMLIEVVKEQQKEINNIKKSLEGK